MLLNMKQAYDDYLVPFLHQRYNYLNINKLDIIDESDKVLFDWSSPFGGSKKANLYIANQSALYLATFQIYENVIEYTSIDVAIAPDSIKTDVNINEDEYAITDYSNMNYYVYCDGIDPLYLYWHVSCNRKPFVVLVCQHKDAFYTRGSEHQYTYCADKNYENFFKSLDISNKPLLDLINIHSDNYYDYMNAYKVLRRMR